MANTLPPGFVLDNPRKSATPPPGFVLDKPASSRFQPVNNGAGEQIGGFSMPTGAEPLNVMVQSTATPPAPAPMTPQQMQSMNLPVPDGQGGIDPRYSSDDHGTPVQAEPLVPEDGAGRALDIALQGMRQGVGELVGFPVDMASAGLNLGAMGVDALVDGDQSWMRSNKPFGGSSQINDMVEGVVPGEPFSYDEMTDAQRLGFEANRFGVQSVVPSGFLSHPAVRQALSKMAPAIA
ncbi:MAG: hypothetical protein JWQ22_129, partial [Devosia sp.]|nr:hypothetical protein [Devosia sp.]